MLQDRIPDLVVVRAFHGTGGEVSKKIDKVIHYVGEVARGRVRKKVTITFFEKDKMMPS